MPVVRCSGGIAFRSTLDRSERETFSGVFNFTTALSDVT